MRCVPIKTSDPRTSTKHKLALICEQVDLQPGDKVIEIGWGGAHLRSMPQRILIAM